MRPQMEDVLITTARQARLSRDEILSHSRKRNLARPRQIAMYLCRQFSLGSYPEIARYFGLKDHTTAIHACRRISRLIGSTPAVTRDVAAVRQRLDIDFPADVQSHYLLELHVREKANAEWVACMFLEWVAGWPQVEHIVIKPKSPFENYRTFRILSQRGERARPRYLPLPPDFKAPNEQLMMRGR